MVLTETHQELFPLLLITLFINLPAIYQVLGAWSKMPQDGVVLPSASTLLHLLISL